MIIDTMRKKKRKKRTENKLLFRDRSRNQLTQSIYCLMKVIITTYDFLLIPR